jgi:hypothetical protein
MNLGTSEEHDYFALTRPGQVLLGQALRSGLEVTYHFESFPTLLASVCGTSKSKT